MNSTDEIKHYIIQHSKLEDLIKEDTDIKKIGTRLLACCPFHEEKTPSFYIFSDHYHCFGCKAHGDAINYVREKKGLGFIEALEFLGEKLGIDCSPIHKNKQQRNEWKNKSRRASVYQISQEFFTSYLFSEWGKEAYHYILSRNYSHEQIKTFGFGFSLNSPNALSRHLLAKGFSKTELQEYSLANVNQDQVYDFFRARLMIPIKDIRGQIIAFAGRTLTSGGQKYKNSRYDKGSFLFGLNHAYKAIKKNNRVIVVEGYLDAIRLWSLGLDEVVACQGTTLTLDHMHHLKKLTKRVYLLFDGDKAGQSSGLKLINDTLSIGGVSFYFAQLPEKEDPDSYSLKYGIDKLRAILNQATPLIEFVIKERFKSVPEQKTPELLRNELLPWVQKVIDPLEKAYLLKKIAEFSGINENLLLQEVDKEQYKITQKNKELPKIDNKQTSPKLAPYIRDLMGHLYFSDSCHEANLDEIEKFYHKEIELPEPWDYFFKELLVSLKEDHKAPHKKPNHAWLSSHSPEITDFLSSLQKDQPAFICSNRSQQLEKTILTHKKHIIKNKIKTLKVELHKQSLTTDRNHCTKILMEINELYRKLALICYQSH